MRPATLRTHVTFRTSRFNQTEVRPYFINPNCFGDDCAAWLVSGLHERGWKDVSEPWFHQVLMAGPEVEHIRWHFEDVFMGDSSAGEHEPVSPRTTAESAS